MEINESMNRHVRTTSARSTLLLVQHNKMEWRDFYFLKLVYGNHHMKYRTTVRKSFFPLQFYYIFIQVLLCTSNRIRGHFFRTLVTWLPCFLPNGQSLASFLSRRNISEKISKMTAKLQYNHQLNYRLQTDLSFRPDTIFRLVARSLHPSFRFTELNYRGQTQHSQQTFSLG